MIIHSIAESHLFQLKFGRYEGVLDNVEALQKQIVEEQFDFVRLKVLNPGDTLFMLLNRIGFPFHLLDIHRLYTLDLHNYEVPPLELPDMQFINCTVAEQEQMKQLITQSYTEWPMGFFRNDVIEKYFPLPLQIENFAGYIATNYIELGNPARQSWLIKLNEEFIGCAATDFKGESSFTPYVGLLPQFRKKHLFTNIARHLQHSMKAAGVKYANGSIRLHNLANQINLEREGQKYIGHDYVFMLDCRIR